MLERPITCPTLIGRSGHLEAIDLAIQDAVDGRGQVVLISGEAGTGKSRLIGEARTRCARAGFSVLYAQCFEPDRALPYAPLRDLLHDLVTSPAFEDIGPDLGTAIVALGDLLPEMQRALLHLPALSPLGPAEEKRRRVEALSELCAVLAAAHPLAIVVEDVHWSDEASLETLQHLTRRLPAQSIALWLTYRSDEVQTALGRFLAGLDRERSAIELKLDGLNPAQVGDMLRAIFGSARLLRPDFLSSIYELTEGNPFFIEEVLKSLVASGDISYADGRWDSKPFHELQVPRTVRDAVRTRTDQLSPTARRVLVLAAVTGRQFDFTLLEELTGSDEGRLLEALKELITAQLVVEVSADQFAFRHALTRESIATELLARERRALHRTIAETLERMTAADPEPPLADLAYHCFEAGRWQEALDACARMGERAQALSAPGAAVEQLTHALYAATQLGLDPLPAHLLGARGLAYETLGEFELARADHEAALASARRTGDRAAEWRALLNLGALWAARAYEQSGALYQQALVLARELDDRTVLARSLNRIGNWHVNVERPTEAVRYHEQALAAFDELGDADGTAETLDLLGLACLTSGDLTHATAYWERAVALFRSLGRRQALSSTLSMSGNRGGGYASDTMIPTAALDACVQDAEEALAIARDIGWRAGEAYCLRMLASCLGPQGQYGRALDCAAESQRIAEDIGHLQWTAAACCALGQAHLDVLAFAAARPYLEKAVALARQTGSQIWTCMSTALLAEVDTRQHELARAASLLDAVLDTQVAIVPLGQRTVWRTRIELALADGAPALALQLIDRLAASPPGDRDGAAATNQPRALTIPRLARLRGEALLALQRTEEAEASLMAAREGAARQGARGQLWRTELALGRLYRTVGRRDDAERAFLAAHTLVDELAANVPPGPLRDDFVSGTATLLPRGRPVSPMRAAKQAFGGLTAREREVAARIAQGKSNRAIADELVISERTVEAHTANILAKLGVSARTQIATWALEHGLADPSTPT